ncbi:MAG: AI-2E family transporter [Gammaproteobacteria bacterium]|nr:AI-2E family transporter [Gammaproteobacteria bacterium]
MNFIKDWWGRHFTDPQVVGLAIVLLAGFLVVYVAGGMLAPVLASVVIAYLLESPVQHLTALRVPRVIAVIVVFSLFMASVGFLCFGVLPVLSQQTAQLLRQLPEMIAQGQGLLLALPQRYPDLVTTEQVQDIITAIRIEAIAFGQEVLSISVASVLSVITVLVYLVLMPLLVFFFLKDKVRLLRWLNAYLPADRELVSQVWMDVNLQIGNYVRGKVTEIIIIGTVTYVTFLSMKLDFSLLLAVLNGLSVIIPYIGATVVTFPIVIIAYFQFGITPDFWWVVGAYFVIQIIDGNVLVPLMFSEVVNLHPIAIIVAILIFGGLWGFWGVFFAIPLATLVQAVLKAWPTSPGSAAGTGTA